eukprot:TRINITY_DN13105_c0_g1_i1.p1 TRINITY_DN13105_c0_g1~~TRINITY_DN13105_c0_g1_i1.p1  ORF type:complete len:223 (+),score=30.94 TRINITY_DN13105_c0_g1_i1:129-797(+)
MSKVWENSPNLTNEFYQICEKNCFNYDISSEDDKETLLMICENIKGEQLLEGCENDWDHIIGYRGRTILSLACELGHIPYIDILLAKEGTDINITDNYGATSLISSVFEYRNEDVVLRLLEDDNIDVNINAEGDTALNRTICFYSGDIPYNLNIMNALLDRDDIVVNNSRNFIDVVIKHGLKDQVQKILSKTKEKINLKHYKNMDIDPEIYQMLLEASKVNL